MCHKWRCQGCGLVNKSGGWRCAACDRVARHARVYHHEDMTPVERTAAAAADIRSCNSDLTGLTVPRCNTITVMSSKENSCQEAPHIALDDEEYSPATDRTTVGVSRSHSHGSVARTRSGCGIVDVENASSTRSPGISMSDSVSCLYFDNGFRKNARSYSPKTRCVKKKQSSSSESDWELNFIREYKREQNKALCAVKKWSCIKCTLENLETRSNCEVCLAPRNSVARPCRTGTWSVKTLSRNESMRRRNDMLTVPSTGGVIVTVPDWLQTEPTLNAQKMIDPRPAYQRSLSEQVHSMRSSPLPSGKVISSRRSLHECFDLSTNSNGEFSKISSSTHTDNKLDRPSSYISVNRHSATDPDVQTKLIHDKNPDSSLDEKEEVWDECQGVIYALPNKGKYKDLNLQLQVSDVGGSYSYVPAAEELIRRSGDSQLTESEYAQIDSIINDGEKLREAISVSQVTSVTDNGNLKTSHIGTRITKRDIDTISDEQLLRNIKSAPQRPNETVIDSENTNKYVYIRLQNLISVILSRFIIYF